MKDLLAHSSVKITEGYMGSFDTSVNDKALEDIFKKEDSPKVELLSLLDKMSPEEIANALKTLGK